MSDDTVHTRVTSNSNTEEITSGLTNELHEIACTREPILMRLKCETTRSHHGITAQRHDVDDVGGATCRKDGGAVVTR